MFVARLLVVAMLVWTTDVSGADTSRLPVGKGKYEFQHPGGSLEVYTFKPSTFTAATPVWFIMHGVNRNADSYRDSWAKAAEAHRAIVISPRFPEEGFPRYQVGEIADKDGVMRPREKTVFALLERVFDDVVAREGLSCKKYSIFGHSAGGQLVHRMILFAPDNRIELAVAANAGWYTLPVRSKKFPFGLEGTDRDDKMVAHSFGAPLIVLLGEADTDPMHPQLSHSAGAEEQGPHRFARGQNFFRIAKDEAARLNVPFRWKLETIPGVAHSNGEMAPAAAKIMAGGSPTSSAGK